MIASGQSCLSKRGQRRLQVYEYSVSICSLSPALSLALSLSLLSDGWIVSLQIYLHHVRRRQQLKVPLLWNKWDQTDTHYLLCYLRGLASLTFSLGGFSKSPEPQQTCREHLIGFGEHGAGAHRALGGIIEPNSIKTSSLLWTIKH